MKKNLILFLSLLIVSITMLLSANFATAQQFTNKNNKGPETGLPLPRFVSLKSDKTNVRTGPGLRYPIKWVMVRKSMPVEIISEYGQWRKIKDIQEDEGWVHTSVLTGKRTAIIQINGSTLTEGKSDNSSETAVMENGVIVNLNRCNMDMCHCEVLGIEGYTQKLNLWGVYHDEVFE